MVDELISSGLLMKAAILEKLNAPLAVDTVEIPELKCGQVLVKIHASGICGKQIDEISGAAGDDRYLPHLLGHEGGGIVVKCGPCVIQIEKGDHVVLHWRKGAGIEASPPKYRRCNIKNEPIGGGPITTFNEYAIVSENRLTAIGKDIPFEIAALMGCAVTTGLGIINNEARLKMGESIAVIGCGGVGLNVIQGAAMVSADPIVAIDIHENKLEMAKNFGATHTVLLNKVEEPIVIIKLALGIGGFHTVVECTGLSRLINIAYILTWPNGKTILVGQPNYRQNLTITNMRQHYCGKTIMDSQGGLTEPSTDIPRYLKLYRAGKLALDELITHRFKLEQINKALDTVRSGKAGKCIIEMD